MGCGCNKIDFTTANPCCPPAAAPCKASGADDLPGPLVWFKNMVQNAYDYVQTEKESGRPLVGIMCEYTPREIIMAAGAMPVCLCGGDVDMIPPAEEMLPANLCPLIKSTFGYSLKKSNPFLESADLLVAETTCDGKKKMYELLAESYPMHLIELPQKPNDPHAKEHWVAELHNLKNILEKRFNVEITNEKLDTAIKEMNHERALRRKLAQLMTSDSPPLTGCELLDLKSLISCIPADIKQYEQALDELPGRELIPSASKRTRVIITGVPIPHGAERVMQVIESSGGLVVAQENCTGIKPIYEDVEVGTDDPIRAIAEKYIHLPCSVMVDNSGRMDLLRELTDEYRPDCIIELVWQACITYDVESFYVKRLAENELKIPYLRIETDYSPSDSARIAMRVQALFEMV